MAFPGRTTATLVGGVVELDPTIPIDPFIDAANEMVTEVCASLVVSGTTTPAYDAHRLEMIETWLSAHFYAIRDAQSQEDQAGSVRARFQGRTDLGLRNTWWGQQAMRLDTLGALALLDNSQNKYTKVPPAITGGGGTTGTGGTGIAKAYWLGTPICQKRSWF